MVMQDAKKARGPSDLAVPQARHPSRYSSPNRKQKKLRGLDSSPKSPKSPLALQDLPRLVVAVPKPSASPPAKAASPAKSPKKADINKATAKSPEKHNPYFSLALRNSPEKPKASKAKGAKKRKSADEKLDDILTADATHAKPSQSSRQQARAFLTQTLPLDIYPNPQTKTK